MHTKVTELNEITDLKIFTGVKLIATYFLLNGEKVNKVILISDFKQWADETGCRESMEVMPGQGGEVQLVLADWDIYFQCARFETDLLEYLQFILPFKSAICL